MRVLVRHGHFAFFPSESKEIARYSQFFDADLVRDGDFFTFEELQGLPRYSLAGQVFGNLPAIATYEGRGPWDVMRENDFVFNLTTKLIVPKLSITTLTQPIRSNAYYLSPAALFQPGARDNLGQQILSYDAEYDPDFFKLRLIEVSYE